MELDAAKRLIKKYVENHADVIMRYAVAQRYYENKNDILFPPLPKEEKEENPLRNADNRISNGFHGLLVNQKASYMFTAPPIFDVGTDNANKTIMTVLGDKYPKVCKDLSIAASNGGVAWIHYWKDEKGGFKYGVIGCDEIVPVWTSDLDKQLQAVFRVYKKVEDDGNTYVVYEYWTDAECQTFRRKENDSVDEGLTEYNMFVTMYLGTNMMEETSLYQHEWGRVPFIPFFNNNICSSDLNNVKKLIDVYDKVFSGFVNDLEDIQEVIFVLSGYAGTSLAEFLNGLKKYKTIKVDADEGSSPGVSTLTIDIPIEARKELLSITRKAIFEQGQGVDPQPDKFGDASGVALKYLYSLLELKAGLAETEFRLGFGELVRAICSDFNIKCENITQTWTRTAITNDSELTAICKDSVGIISNKSIIKAHPLVDNPSEEMKQLEKEKEEQTQNTEYADAFSNAIADSKETVKDTGESEKNGEHKG